MWAKKYKHIPTLIVEMLIWFYISLTTCTTLTAKAHTKLTVQPSKYCLFPKNFWHWSVVETCFFWSQWRGRMKNKEGTFWKTGLTSIIPLQVSPVVLHNLCQKHDWLREIWPFPTGKHFSFVIVYAKNNQPKSNTFQTAKALAKTVTSQVRNQSFQTDWTFL